MKRIVFIFTISIFLFFLVAIVVISKVQSLINADKEISKITLVYEDLISTRLALRLAIINQRDYILTSDTIHLNRFYNQKIILNNELNNLLFSNKNYVILNNDSLLYLSNLIQEKIIQLDKMVELKLNNRSDKEIELVLESDAVSILDMIKNVSDRLQLILEKKKSDFRLSTTKNSRKIIWTLILGFLAGILMLLYSFISLINEIKRRVKVEKELKQKSELLYKAIKTKDRFFSILAHDLRNPFNAILGINELIINKMKGKDKKLEELAEESQKTSKNTFNLLHNLLEWSRIQTGDLKPFHEIFNLKTVIDENIDLYKQAAKNKEIEFTFRNVIDIEVFADRNMISTIIRNLINNAIKFSFPGGKIHVFLEISTDKAFVCIKDSGIGISEEHMKQLFKIDQKLQMQGTSDEKGSGLGLILCKDLIEKNNGKIFVESEIGKSTTFKFYIPLKY